MSVGKNRKKRLERRSLRIELDTLRGIDPQHYRVRWQQLLLRWAGEARGALHAGDPDGFVAVFDRVRGLLGPEYGNEFEAYSADTLRAAAVHRLGRTSAGVGRRLLCSFRTVFGPAWAASVVRELAGVIKADTEGEISARAGAMDASVWWLLQIIDPHASEAEVRELVIREVGRAGRSVRTVITRSSC